MCGLQSKRALHRSMASSMLPLSRSIVYLVPASSKSSGHFTGRRPLPSTTCCRGPNSGVITKILSPGSVSARMALAAPDTTWVDQTNASFLGGLAHPCLSTSQRATLSQSFGGLNP